MVHSRSRIIPPCLYRWVSWRGTLTPVLPQAFVRSICTRATPMDAEVRETCGVPVGVTTGTWIEPDLGRGLELVRAWRVPDYTSVNLSEPGATEIMGALIQAGIGAGVWTVEDAERLGASGKVTRILVEPGELQLQDGRDKSADALALVEDIHRTLDGYGLTAPRLQHGDGEGKWVLLEDAIHRGLDTRIGLEDTLYEPNGEHTAGNEALVRAARELGAE